MTPWEAWDIANYLKDEAGFERVDFIITPSRETKLIARKPNTPIYLEVTSPKVAQFRFA